MLLQNADGTKTTTEILKGSAYSRNAGIRHNVINVSDKFMSFIEIEIKTK